MDFRFSVKRPAAFVMLAMSLSIFPSTRAAFAADAEVPAYLTPAQASKKLPATLPPARFSHPAVKRAYQIAGTIPKVIAQQPCYCWCSKHAGHDSLLDCYVDEHASQCDMCIKEVLLADRMHKQGKSPAAIRQAIIRGEWKNI